MENKSNEISVEEKLRALYDLQIIDSRLDELRSVRGELPLEVEDLENEIGGLETRVDKFKAEVKGSEIRYCPSRGDDKKISRATK